MEGVSKNTPKIKTSLIDALLVIFITYPFSSQKLEGSNLSFTKPMGYMKPAEQNLTKYTPVTAPNWNFSSKIKV